MLKDKIRMYLIVSLVASVVTAGIVYASGYWMVSNNLEGSSTSKATLTLTSNATSPAFIGDIFHLTAHVSDNSANLPVTFYDNDVAIGTSILTDQNGNAILDYQENNAVWNITAKAFHP